MKPIRLPDDLIAARLSSLDTVSRRICRIRGLANSDDGDSCEKTNSDPEAKESGSVRIIPIRGILMRDCRGWFPWATDTEEIEELLDEAENDNNVTEVLLDIDSPGGSYTGTVELANKVAAMSKRVVAYCAGECCSAAYWVACSCDDILVRPSSVILSVGVYAAVIDQSAAYSQAGLAVDLIKHGENKAAGYPGTSLTDSQRAVMQDRITSIGIQFSSFVERYRTGCSKEFLDGRVLYGDEAVFHGFADYTVSSLREAMEMV